MRRLSLSFILFFALIVGIIECVVSCKDDDPCTTVTNRKVVEVCNSFGKRPEKFADADSETGEFPHFATLGYRRVNDRSDELSFYCGGSLIGKNLVLTAAHCCKESLKPSVVRLGKTSTDDADSYVPVDVNISLIIRHPDYWARFKYNDIALIKLDRDVTFSEKIWPACVHLKDDYLSESLIIAGIGRNDIKDSTKHGARLQKAEVTEVPLSVCRKTFADAYGNNTLRGLSKGIADSMICAVTRDGHANLCQGHSGSALQFFSDDTYHIVGVTSFGVSCNTRLPSFYSRVSSFLDWIEEYL